MRDLKSASATQGKELLLQMLDRGAGDPEAKLAAMDDVIRLINTMPPNTWADILRKFKDDDLRRLHELQVQQLEGGPKKRVLDDALRRPQRKREAALYQQRASLLFATGDFSDAADDYEKIIEYSGGVSLTRFAYVGLIRCEANRRRWSQLTKAMRNSGMTVAEIEALGVEDPVMQGALQHDRVKAALKKLRRAQAPK